MFWKNLKHHIKNFYTNKIVFNSSVRASSSCQCKKKKIKLVTCFIVLHWDLHIYKLKSNMNCLLWQNGPEPWKATVSNTALIWNQIGTQRETRHLTFSTTRKKHFIIQEFIEFIVSEKQDFRLIILPFLLPMCFCHSSPPHAPKQPPSLTLAMAQPQTFMAFRCSHVVFLR